MLTWLREMSAGGGLAASKALHTLPWLVRYSMLELPRLYERVRYDRLLQRSEICDDPVFIIGHWRSGTSMLQELISADPQFATPSAFDAMFPECMLTTRGWLPSVLQFGINITGAHFDGHDRPLQMSLPAEDDFFLLCLGDAESAYWGHLFPHCARERFLREADDAWLDSHRYMVRKLGVAYPGRRLLLKSPPNTMRIAALKRAYPKARFVFIHRHPFDTFASTCRLWRLIDKQTMLQSLDDADLEDLVLDIQARLYDRYFAARESLQQDEIIEVSLTSVGTEPMRAMREVYARLDLGDLPVSAFEERLAAMPEPVIRNYELSAEIKARLATRLRPALEAWGYDAG